VDVFTTGGPNAGSINAAVKIVGSSPPTDDVVFVGTNGGVFKSVDGATTWTSASTGLTNRQVRALAIGDAGPPVVIYAGTGGGVFKSVDGGATWVPVNNGLVLLLITALAVAPSDPNTVYAATQGQGVFVTTNAGASWSPTGAMADPGVFALAVNPVDPLTVYAGIQGGAPGGVYKTTNGGGTWNPFNTGIPAGPGRDIRALTIGDGTSADILYAATFGGVFGTTDGAVNWVPESGLTPTDIRAIFLEKPGTLPRTIIAGTDQGIFVGTDPLGSGATWVQSNGTAPNDLTNLSIGAIAVNPIIYAGTLGNGVFLTTDSGATWAEMNDGLRAGQVLAVATDPTDSTIVYAGLTGVGWLNTSGGGGVHGSVDSGVNWTHLNDASLTNLFVQTLGVNSFGEIFAGTLGGGIFLSVDGGVTWTDVNTGDLAASPFDVGPRAVRALAVAPGVSGTAYAFVHMPNSLPPAPVGLFKTVDGGASWTNQGGITDPNTQFVLTIALDPVTPGTIYVGTLGDGVLKSVDDGATFNPANNGLTDFFVRDLALNPTGTVLYAATSGGVFQSVDGAASWTPGNTGLTSLDVTAIHNPGFGVVVAGTADAGVFGSTDGGLTWGPLTNSSTNLRATALSHSPPSLSPPPSGRFYVGTDGGGVFEYNPTFAPLTVFLAGTGAGTVSSLPGPLTCMGGSCGGSFFTNMLVTLTATPAPGSVLIGWTGGGCSGAGTCTVIAAGPIAVTATFALIPPGTFTLTLNKAGTGSGTVTVAPAALACDAACIGIGVRDVSGTIFTLTATPASGTFFAGWSGAGCTGTGPCTFPLIADTTVSATFGAPEAILVGPGPGGGPHVRTFAPSGLPGGASFMAYAPAFTNGLYVALAHLTGPGPTQLVTGAGAGGGPHVRVFNPDGSDFGLGFFAYAPAFPGGVRVAAGDVDGDGRDEIIVAPGPGGGPHVRVFKVEIGPPASLVELASFFAFDPAFTGGVFVAAGDLDGDGRAELIVGADAGGGPHVRVLSLTLGPTATLTELASFFAFDPTFTGGVRVAAADLDGNGRAELITAAGPGGLPEVRVWAGLPPTLLASFLPYPASFAGGVFVGAGQVDGTGPGEILTGPGPGWNPHVRAFTLALTEIASFFAYDPLFLGGVRVSASP
jgi:photosystem II stability/assembly factor-like uncharacterized protein